MNVEALTNLGVSVMQSVSGYAVYANAKALLPHIPPLEYPGKDLGVALYTTGGIRGVEIGSAMFGQQPDGSEEPASLERVRLAIPRRAYTQGHVDYVIECFEQVYERRDEVGGHEITEESQLRHFTAHFRSLAPACANRCTDDTD
jgi:tryptophanase (EC 4.1.99.1)